MDNVTESWTEISITVDTKDIEIAGSIANMVVPYGIYIEDYSALEEETLQIAHIDLIEESLLRKDRSKELFTFMLILMKTRWKLFLSLRKD